MSDNQLTIFYFEITNLWRDLCEEHNRLFNLTCDEYSLLLSSDLNLLEEKIEEKNNCVERINKLEKVRREIISEINNQLPEVNIQGVAALLEYMSNFHVEKKEKHLYRFNSLLIDIIEKIQAQNRRNQLFINKALHSLQEIRIEAMGKKSFSTYTSKGSALQSIG